MTQSNLLELAQQGDPQAIAALMNQSLQPRGMTATVERAGDSLSVLLEADQVPNRQTLTAFVQRGISNLGIESIRSVKVLGQQTGTNLPVWTQDLTLELPTTAAEAIDAVDLSPPVDSTVDLSLTDDDDELEALWIAPSDEQSQDSLADLLAEEPADDLQILFNDQPEEFEAGLGTPDPLEEELRGMFGDQSEADFPPLEESSFNGANLNSMGAGEANSLQDLFGEDPEEDSLSQLDGMFSEPTFTESNLGLTNDLDGDLDRDLNNDLGLESNNSDDLADLFGDRPPDEEPGMYEETPPDEEEFQDLFGETAAGTTSEVEGLDGLLEPPSAGAIAPEEELSPELAFLEESSSERNSLSNLEEDSLQDFSDQESEQSEDLLGERFAGIEVEVSEPLLFDEPGDQPGDQPVSFDDLETADEPIFPLELEPSPVSIPSSSSKSFQEQQALADFFADDPLADFLPQLVQPPGEEFLEGGLSEPMAAATAQDYFNSPEPSTDFRTENLNSVPLSQPDLEDDQDFLNQTSQPPEPADLFSERMNSLEAEFPEDLQVDPLEQPDRDLLSSDEIAASIDWDGALENPLPDVEVNQADTVSSLESLTDDPDLHNVQTEALFEEPPSDRFPDAEPTLRQDIESTLIQEPQPDRWDLDSDDEPTAIEDPLPSTVGVLGASPRAGALEDLTVSLPNLPDDGYEQQVAYPSLNDPTQAPPQPKGSPWLLPLVIFGLIGWVLALVGFSYWLKERDTPPPPIVQPSAGSPAPSIPPAPASPSSALPDVEDSAALPKNLD